MGLRLGFFDGYMIPESAMPFHLANSITNYAEEDARIRFTHENGAVAHIELSPEHQTRFFIDHTGNRLNSSKKFLEAFPVDLIVVPTLAPLESEERLVQRETARQNRTTRLAARSFRNIWLQEEPEVFEVFKSRVERAWPGVALQPPERVMGQYPTVEMFFEENRVAREIQWAGFGFQVWLQIHTHLIRGKNESILVLDEPDIYLHPDLQHRLYADVKELFSQFFLATHAIEIINVADTRELLMVEPNSSSIRRIRKDSDYDEMLHYIGSAENADFAKIMRAKKVLFVEGNDAKMIRRFAKKIGLERLGAEQSSPVYKLGGFSQWKRAQDTVWAFQRLLDVEIGIICLFDRDFRCRLEAEAFVAQMADAGLRCFVLSRKEFENYLISPAVIARCIRSRLAKKEGAHHIEVNEAQVSQFIEDACIEQKTYVSAQIASNSLRHARTTGSSDDDATIISRELDKFEHEWESIEGKLRLAPGKELLKRIFDRAREDFGVSLTVPMVQEQFRHSEIDPELREILVEIDGFFSVG